MLRIVPIHFDLAVASGLVASAKKDRVSIRQRDIVFVVDGHKAIGCVRKINSITVRLCGCWVAPESRGQGLGKALVRHRFEFACKQTSAKKVDTFAFHPSLFIELGFEARQKFKMGTTHLVYAIPEDVIRERAKWDSAYWQNGNG